MYVWMYVRMYVALLCLFMHTCIQTYIHVKHNYYYYYYYYIYNHHHYHYPSRTRARRERCSLHVGSMLGPRSLHSPRHPDLHVSLMLNESPQVSTGLHAPELSKSLKQGPLSTD